MTIETCWHCGKKPRMEGQILCEACLAESIALLETLVESGEVVVEDKTFQGLLESGCSHCGGDLLLIDEGPGKSTCVRCGCVWEWRLLLMLKPDACASEEEVYRDMEVEEDTESRLNRL